MKPAGGDPVRASTLPERGRLKVTRVPTAAQAALPVNSVENYPRASVVDAWRRIEPLARRASSVLLAMWFEHGTLTYSCPETTRPVRTGIIADTATIEKLSFFKLSVWCPHCETPHTILGKQASISHSQDQRQCDDPMLLPTPAS